jgi:hypothetical protein
MLNQIVFLQNTTQKTKDRVHNSGAAEGLALRAPLEGLVLLL